MSSMKSKDILIIDDSADIRLLAKRILEGDGARVFEADNVDTGFELATTKAPQLIFLDIEMPGKSGFDFLSLRKNHATLKNIPVIILSGKKDKGSVVLAIELGAEDYILKPFRATLLLQKIRKSLRLTSFLRKKFTADQQPNAVFSLVADVIKVSEGGCQCETSVKLGADEKIFLDGEIIERLFLQDILMKSSQKPGKFVSPGRYLNEIIFVGMNEEKAKVVRHLIKEFK